MFSTLLKTRRSIRRFSTDPIEPEKLNTIVEAALRAPSSRGLNPWEFIVVTDGATLKRLAGAKPHGASFLAHATAGIVVIADPNRCDVWIEDASIASILIHLTAHDLGLGSCWIQIRNRMRDESQSAEDYIAKLLKIPSHFNVESIVAIGYPEENKPPHPHESLQLEKVHIQRYGQPMNPTDWKP